jgi:hypothetical protein
VDDAEVNRLCKQLSALSEHEPGCNPDALSRTRWAIMSLRSMELGDDIDQKLVALADAFEEWFGIDKSNRKDQGPLGKQKLEDALICFMAAIWRERQGFSVA